VRALVDTNIVLRGNASAGLEGPIRRKVRALTGEGLQLCIAGQSITEAWVVMTRPVSANGLGLKPEDARRELDDAVRIYSLIADPPDLNTRWLDICVARRVIGRQAFDARLAAVMIGLGIRRLVTLNPIDFSRYPELELIVPDSK
jgi:hypothetical protein